MAVVIPLNHFMGPEGDTVTVDEQLLNTEYCGNEKGCLRSRCLSSVTDNGLKYNIKPCHDDSSLFDK